MQQRPQRRHGPLPTIPIVLSIDERGALAHLCRSGKTEHRVAMRARAILLAADGWPNDAQGGKAPGTATPWAVLQPSQPLSRKAASPFAHPGVVGPQVPGDGSTRRS